MADPLSITASLLAVLIATTRSAQSLYETTKRLKDRNKSLRRLQDELEDLVNILNSLKEEVNVDLSVLTLLQGPVDRCGQVCREFEHTMQVFTRKSKTGFLDWTKMEFMRGDINEFIDTISAYKSTISVGLGTITMHTCKVSQQVLEQYNEMIQDTAYNLELHLKRIDEKMAQFTTENTNTSDVTIDLKDDGVMTKQCIQICGDAVSAIKSLIKSESTLSEQPYQSVAKDGSETGFEAQLPTRHRDSLAFRQGLEVHDMHGEGTLHRKMNRPNAVVADHTSDSVGQLNAVKQVDAKAVSNDLGRSKTTKSTGMNNFTIVSPMSTDNFGSCMNDDQPTLPGANETRDPHKKPYGAEQTCGAAELGRSLGDPNVFLTPNRVEHLLGNQGEQANTEGSRLQRTNKTHKGTQNEDKENMSIIDMPKIQDDCTDSERSWAASSLWDTPESVGSSATSALPSGIMRISIQKLADVVLDDTSLTKILTASLSHPYLQAENVLEEFKHLMRCYYTDLQDLSTTPDHKKVIRLLKKSKGTITSRVRQTLGLKHAEWMLLDRGKKLSQQEKREITRYLLRTECVLEDPSTTGLVEIGTQDVSGEEDDSEDDNNFADDLHPEIFAAIVFLKDGWPMQKFQADLCQFILDATRKHDVLQSPISLPRSLPNIVDDIWRRICPNLPEGRIPPGRRRIRWTCSCGLKMYDDFDELIDSAALDDLEARFNTNNFTQCSKASENAVPQVFRWVVRRVQLLKSHVWGQPVNNDALPTHHARTMTAINDATPESRSTNLLYLLHCNSTGEYGVKLHQDLIHYKLNDQELFKFLRTVYCRARTAAKWLTLRNTTNISLCKFFVDRSHHASVRKHGPECMQQSQHCVCLPPRDLVGREYQCHPTPPDPMPLPPFEKNYLMHYFLNPDHLSPDQIWAYKQLPKRMNVPLEPGPGSFLPGWGIYFEDGWNFKTIYLLISLATIVGSAIFGICWSILKLDVSGAFGITSYWVAVVVMGLGFMALRSTNKL